MKRRFVILLTAICALIFASCAAEDPGHDILNPYFTGRVIEKYENNCLLEVTDIGNGNFFVGERLIVTTDIENCPDYEPGDCLTVVFDGKVALSYPGQVLNVFQISKTDLHGNSVP